MMTASVMKELSDNKYSKNRMSSEYSYQCPQFGYVDLCASKACCMEDACIFLQNFVSNHNILIHQQEGISTRTGMVRMKMTNYLSAVIVVSCLRQVELLVQLTEFFLVECKCCQGVNSDMEINHFVTQAKLVAYGFVGAD